MLTLLLLLQVAAPPAEDRCVAMMRQDVAGATAAAEAWGRLGDYATARQCLGLALANRGEWTQAAAAFEAAAGASEPQTARAATNQAQAGNAWLAAGQPQRALSVIQRALANPALEGLERGEAELDRARALVATGDRVGARAALDQAAVLAADDPLVWLMSATFARQAGDRTRARVDIARALRMAPDDAAVQLEAGNIAAAAGDAPGAQAAWREAARLRPGSPQAAAAAKALEQFD